MLALLFLIAAAATGWAVVRAITRDAFGWIQQFFAGLVIGWMLATGAAYLVARFAGALTSLLMVRSTIGMLIVAAITCWWALKRTRGIPWRRESWWLVLLLVVFVPIYCVLFNTRMLQERPDGIYSGGTSTYDMAFHVAISTSFLYGRNFPPVYTLLPPDPALYPFLPDFLTAALVAGGMSFHAALCLTGIALASAVAVLLYSFASLVLRKEGLAPAVAATLFLLNGGFAFLYLWRGGENVSLALPDIQWTNIIVDALLPQRASLFGLPAGLLVLTIFAATWSRPPNEWRGLAVAGVITGTLPFFHAHSYLAIAILSGFLFLLRPRAAWLAFWAPAVLIASPQLLLLAQHAVGDGNMRIQPGWLGRSQANWLLVWLKNAGLPTLLIIPAWLAAPAEWRRFYLAFAGLLLIALVVVFSPNDTDNLKLLFYWYTATSVLIAGWLVGLRPRLLALVLGLACVASGVLALHNESRSRELMFSRAQIDAAEFVRTHTPPDALFVTGPTFHQPVLSLAGRSVVRANTTWPWSHGYEFRAREADLRRIYAATTDARELLEFYRADYLYLSEVEKQELRANEAVFDEWFPIVYNAGGIKIYETRGGRSGPGGRIHLPAPREFSSRITTDPYQMLVEFPRISYFLYRLYVVSLGRQPRYEEFIADLHVLGRGLYVGAPGWEMVVAQNKAALLQEKSADRLEAAIEDRALYRREYDRAWVLIHYFAYLRRNPDDPPADSMAGYNYWLNRLTGSHDYRSISRAFLESIEYKQRLIENSLVR
ncbi:MAG TPA: hypothetical protein VG095_06050 [Chthoniobacterales bacterium]|nr:hypothetical protein [Chthoniobacterales bacterium]